MQTDDRGIPGGKITNNYRYGGQPVNGVIAAQLVTILYEQGAAMKPRDMYIMLAHRCPLRDEDAGYVYDNGRDVWRARVQAAFVGLKLRGDATTKKRGWWELTKQGCEKHKSLGSAV